MSFTYNPFETIIVHVDEQYKGDPLAKAYVLCDSCGAELELKEFGPSTSINGAMTIMEAHVRFSHKRGPDDFTHHTAIRSTDL